MALYPMKFKPILKPVLWGGSEICRFKGIFPLQEGIGESWEISGIAGNVSVVSNGTMQNKTLEELISDYKGQLLGKKIYERFGSVFPLLIKFIDARDNLSIQVHPDDALAKKRHNSFGKTELWYVIDVKDEAFLYLGFKEALSSETYLKSLGDNTFIDRLAKHTPEAGDVFFLPAGRVHGIGAGTFIAEIQQASDITYRIYDYNRRDAQGKTRELHTDLARDAIDYKVYDEYRTVYEKVKNEDIRLQSCRYFTTNLLDLNKNINRDYNNIDSFVIYICMEGEAAIKDNKGNICPLRKGETVLIPADTESVDIQPSPEILLLETYI